VASVDGGQVAGGKRKRTQGNLPRLQADWSFMDIMSPANDLFFLASD
jgi:hypothetical protein